MGFRPAVATHSWLLNVELVKSGVEERHRFRIKAVAVDMPWLVHHLQLVYVELSVEGPVHRFRHLFQTVVRFVALQQLLRFFVDS